MARELGNPGVDEVAHPPTTSERLKQDLAATHQAVERAMRLPQAIQTVADYAATLHLYASVFAPLEDALARRAEWPHAGIDFQQHRRTPALAADIAALTGAPWPPCAEPAPNFTRFSEAFGALYVLEGSALGGRFILRDLQHRLGATIAGATSFLEGRGPQTAPFWQSLKQKLDAYGAAQPDQHRWLQAGAKTAFTHFLQAAHQNPH